MGPRPDTEARTVPLPLLSPHTGARSSITCTYRCGNACSHPVPNASANEYFGDVVARAISRRGVLRAGAVVAVAAGAGVGLSGTAAAAPAAEQRPRPGRGGFAFQAVPPNTEDRVVVPPGYESAIVIRWGDPILPGAPEWDFANQTAAAQAGQFGYNNDFLALLPHRGPFQALLVANHEYTTETLMYPRYDEDAPTPEQIRTSWEAHGMSVVLVRRDFRTGTLTPQVDRVNRRLTVTTPFQLTGPAAGSELVRTTADPEGRTVLGTLNNCAGGVTPWGTVLSGEENFNQYFANAGAVAEPARARLARYGVTTGPTERKWETEDRRFDTLVEPNEPNRFGWIVEVDPYDPASTPRKRTALGRFKHEGAGVRVARDGTVAAYMGDDERFDYLYKFVSSRRFRRGGGRRTREHNAGILDEGTLYVARFTGDSPAAEIDGTGRVPSDGAFDGTGEWIPLATSHADGTGESHVDGFSLAEVLVLTRLAADTKSPTKMDRPEDVEPSPTTGRVYAALTNNTSRTGARGAVDEANPRNQTFSGSEEDRVGNKDGHVLELTEDRDDPASPTFTWTLLLVCGDPADPSTYFAGFPKDQVSPISCPDNVAFDPAGNLWIATDGNALANPEGIKYNDGLFAVPLEGPARGQVKQFLTVPRGAETCGPIIEERLVVVAAQHPGEYDPPAASDPPPTADAPFSRWPEGDASTNPPRPSVVSVWKPGFVRPDPIGG